MNNKEKGIMLINIVLSILIIICLIINLILFYGNTGKIKTSNNNKNVNVGTEENELDDNEEGYYSVLEHLPDFSKTQKDSSSISWPTGIPMNANPLTYNNGLNVDGLYYSDNSYFTDNISLTAEEISKININDENEGLTQYSPSLDKRAYFCCVEVKATNGKGYMYRPICNEKNDNDIRWNSDYYKNQNLTFGDIFERKLYVSKVSLDDFGISYDIPIKKQLDELYKILGNPSGLYWQNDIVSYISNNNIFNTFEEFCNTTEWDEKHGDKGFYLIWDYGDCFVAVSMYDKRIREGEEGTAITGITLFQNIENSEAILEPVEGVVYGYYGYGRCPAQLSLSSSNLEPTN